MRDLKPEWTQFKFGEVVRLNKETCKDPVTAGIERAIGLEHLEPGDLRIRSWGNVADGTTFTKRVRPGQVLFGKRRAYQRKLAVADFDAVCSGDIYVFETVDPSKLLPELLPFICQTDKFFEHAVDTSAGSLSPRTSWPRLAEFELNLPSMHYQRRIAEALQSAQLSQNAYDELLVAAERMRAAAMIELLSRVWQSDTPVIGINELTAHGEQVLKTGPFGSKLKTEYFLESGRPVITIGSISESGLDSTQFSYLGNQFTKEFSEYECRSGDIVFSRVADVGRCHLIQPDEEGFVISSNLIRIRIDQSVIRPKFLWLLLRFSPHLRIEIAKLTTKAAGRLLVNTSTLSKIEIPAPSLSEQDSIIDAFDSLSAYCSTIYNRKADLMNINRDLLDRLS